MTMTLIETKTLGTAAASIEFTNIPQDGTDLLVLTSIRTALTGDVFNEMLINFNGSGSNFSATTLRGRNAGVGSFTGIYWSSTSSSATANTFDSVQIYIPNYSGSAQKSFSVDSVTENNAQDSALHITAGLRANTAAITSLLIKSATSSNLVAGSTVSLYKITKGSSGGVVVS